MNPWILPPLGDILLIIIDEHAFLWKSDRSVSIAQIYDLHPAQVLSNGSRRRQSYFNRCRAALSITLTAPIPTELYVLRILAGLSYFRLCVGPVAIGLNVPADDSILFSHINISRLRHVRSMHRLPVHLV